MRVVRAREAGWYIRSIRVAPRTQAARSARQAATTANLSGLTKARQGGDSDPRSRCLNIKIVFGQRERFEINK
jgi:hypothetical protein